jgi:hypothetical protein
MPVMNTLYHIVDGPLPLNQDFKSLKEEGVVYIQEHMGNEWTNYNPGDPGITILDQVCFALTELGYCNDFSINDILTRPNGKLQVKDQFYTSEEILTSSPLTIDDYRKYVIDGVENVNNVFIIPYSDDIMLAKGIYKVYLYIAPSVSNPEDIANTCKAAFFHLNKRRNLGELFLMPGALQPSNYLISGSIEVEKETDLATLPLSLQEKIRNYIFPKVLPTGYDQLAESGISINDIMDGPLLKNGWIQTDSLGRKKNKVSPLELQALAESLSGVSTVSGLCLYESTGKTQKEEAQCAVSEIISIDVMRSVEENMLQLFYKGKQLILSAGTGLSNNAPLSYAPIIFGPSANTQVTLPKGKFRDIDTYYSIQNTFPEIFAVGADSVISNASNFQVAQSRQLKGYLTLFDQVLANQFSQLANIDRLFSFKNTLSGVPSVKKEYYETEDAFEKHHPEYPVPYLVFSPTYFYQALYNVPHIKPLLKGHDMFDFSMEIESKKEREQNSWDAYKRYAYNPYMRELMEFMEDEKINLQRRNDILDHLLARHGESPLMLDAFIYGSSYTGDNLKDLVIFKSLYLQNLGLLSYYRQKAYNFLGANKILADVPEVLPDFEQHILGGDTNDFIFNSGRINEVEKLGEGDFINYSALELKLCLLFGLKATYRDYISINYENPDSAANIKLALWMITQRRGLVLIETSMLKDPGESEPPYNDTTSGRNIELLFPDFIPQLNTPQFKQRLDLFLENTLPVQLTYNYHFVSAEILGRLVPVFAAWHNTLVYNNDTGTPGNMMNDSTQKVNEILNEIYATGK